MMGISYIRVFLAGIILSVFFINTVSTPFWRITHDATVVHYVAMLVDEFNQVPYLEIFDTAMPAAILIHILIGKIFGYTEQALQLVNFLMIVILFFINLNILKKFQWVARIVGSTLFLVVYQSFGQEMSLERDFISSFFLILAFFFSHKPGNIFFKLMMVGIFCGLASAIKPQFIIMLPVFIFYMRQHFFKNLATSLIFAVLPHLIALSWLHSTGGWDSFWWMQKNYLPYYLQIGHELYFFDNFFERIIHNLKSFFYLLPYWRLNFFILVFGSFLGWKKDKHFVFTIILLSLCSALTLIISGQYFPYHFLTLFSFSYYSICYFFEEHQYQSFSIFAFCLILFVTLGQIPKETQNFVTRKKPHIVRGGKVDRLIDALRSNYKVGDTIQVFDWVDGGTTHALMNLKLAHHGRFITDHLFKHHLHLNTQQEIINSFFHDFKKSSPSLIIKSLEHNYPRGDYSSQKLPKSFLDFISSNYRVIHSDEKFLLYRLNEVL